MLRQNINPLEFPPGDHHPLITLHLHTMAFCFIFADDAALIRLGEMIQRMAGTISESADADYIITPIPMKVGSNAICVNPA
jgi:hypothetical protein